MRDETCYYLTACFPIIQANGFFLKSIKPSLIYLLNIPFRNQQHYVKRPGAFKHDVLSDTRGDAYPDQVGKGNDSILRRQDVTTREEIEQAEVLPKSIKSRMKI